MTARWRSWYPTIAFLCVVALALVAGSLVVATRPAAPRFQALLSSVIGLYPGADVRVLGVPVGTVDQVTPLGRTVRVDFHVDPRYPVPADALALVVAPSLVSDRYLQLDPPYDGGPVLNPGATISLERTGSPPEFNELLAGVRQLTDDLGPDGVNRDGALSSGLTTLARNLDGNGEQINLTLSNLAQALTTLSTSRQDLAGTVDNLGALTADLARDDDQVRAFTEQFAQVSAHLSGEREDIAATLRELSGALDDVAGFVHDNPGRITENLDQIGDVLRVVNQERLSVEQALDAGPAGLDGLINSYDATAGALAARINLVETLVCAVYNLPGLGPALAPALDPILDVLLPGGSAGCRSPAVTNSPLALAPLPLESVTAILRALLAVRPLVAPAAPARMPEGAAPGGPVPGGLAPLPPGPQTLAQTLERLLGGGR